MKKTVLCLSLLASAGAFANSGTITFNGLVTDATCEVTVDGNPASSAVVTLPTVSKDAFENYVNEPVAKTKFIMELTGTACSSPENQVKAFFSYGAGVDPVSGHLKNLDEGGVDGATNVMVALLDLDGDAIVKAGAANGAGNTSQYGAIVGNAATLVYSAGYIAATPSAVTSGKVRSVVDFVLDYK